MIRPLHRPGVRRGAALIATLLSSSVFGQVQQAPVSPQQPGRQLAETPPPRPGSVTVDLPPAKPAFVASDIKVRPAAFRVSGSTVFSQEQLLARLSDFLGKELDFNALADAASALKRVYVDAGYPLTDVYFPEQSFASQGGTVEFAVVEARVGKVNLVVATDVPVSASLIRDMVDWHLVPGQMITQAGLDRTILLLRDMPGITASANVTPGASVGLADITVSVAAQGSASSFSVGFDNFGVKDVGEYRASFGAAKNNLLGFGDSLNVNVQPTDQSGTAQYRAGYSSAFGPAGSKLYIGIGQSQYRLAGAFADLNASGEAKTWTAAAIHPLVRSRNNNVFLQVGADSKLLRDETGSYAPVRSVDIGKLGLLGSMAGGGLAEGAFTSYSLTYSAGRLDIRDEEARKVDKLDTGPGTQGSFQKVNVELQRVEYLTDTLTLHGSLAAQTASKNLTSAEKLSLSGSRGVRGYTEVPDTLVDEGMVASIELRKRLTNFNPFGTSTSISLFYDYGQGNRNKVRNATTNSQLVGTENRVEIDSWGVGARIGIEGDFFVNANLAWRAGNPVFANGSPTRKLWLSAVKFF